MSGFKVGQLVRYCGMPMVVDCIGSDFNSKNPVLCLRHACVMGAPITEFAMIPPHIVYASEVDELIGNNYRSKK